MTKAWDIGLARVYDDPGGKQGARLLVDRVWPRGIRRADLALDDWIREIGPSSDLRSWFGHDPDRWNEFRRLYRAEPDAGGEALECCLAWCRKGPVTLLYGARDDEHNQAVVLLEYLLERRTQVDAA
ncbi:MAG: DUF488 family protein [Rhizobiales bacterium]|nr:DUF488 family protein [Hyphomicrobiales bacterium]